MNSPSLHSWPCPTPVPCDPTHRPSPAPASCRALPALLHLPPNPTLCYSLTTLLQKGVWKIILRCRGTFFVRRGRGKPSGLSLCTVRSCYSRRPHVGSLWAAMVWIWEMTQGFLWSKYLFWHWPLLCGCRVITLVLHFGASLQFSQLQMEKTRPWDVWPLQFSHTFQWQTSHFMK